MAYQYRNSGRNGSGCGCQGENGTGQGNREGNRPVGGRMNDGYRGDGRINGGGIVGFAGTDGPAAPIPRNAALAMAYVPVQPWGETCDLDQALQHGTIFADLDKPFLGEKARCRK